MSYTQPPPDYGSASSSGKPTAPDQEPLLSHEQDEPQRKPQQAQQERPAWQGTDDMSEDFDIGVSVSQSSWEIRSAFIRKVYSMLFVMIVFTTAVGAVMRTQAVMSFVQANQWAPILAMVCSFAFLFGTMWKRHSHPTNLLMLGGFTFFEACTVGSLVAYFDTVIVLQALLVTAFIFIGLTLFTFQSKYDFTGLAPYLFTGLMFMLGMGFVGLFTSWGKTTDLVYSGFGVLLFSGYILYDTSMIMKRLSPDEWVMAVVSLYLDAINVFLYVLRILQNSQD